MTKAAVILSGCGHRDGSEIREAVLALLTLDRLDVETAIFAPDRAQPSVTNHLTGSTENETRNMLTEAARIARGTIAPLADCQPGRFDLLVIPGGYGAALNLSTVAKDGAKAKLEPDFERVVREFYRQQKPIAAICIAPAAVAAALKNEGITLTIGEDASTAQVIADTGNKHEDSPTDKAVTDEPHAIASCSAYMRGDARLSEVARGIEQCVASAVEMARQKKQRAA